MELLAPAGSFSSALYAFSNGADAVYAGMNRFSARSGARNFSFDELRRLKEAALKNGKKIFLAVNTLIIQYEIPALLNTLEECAYLQVDGIIIQDLGAYRLAKRHFPSLRLHASTQLAVHNTEGVRQLIDLGFSRAVLSRELSLEEAGRLMTEEPGIEYEMFIHGALCYSFSGMCLASGKLLGRSANRGMCAQICRTWFETSNGAQKIGYLFSMKDLKASDYIRKLEKLGVTSCKIEGRMKSPEYSGTVSAYYRQILDHGQADPVLEQQLSVLFSRNTTSGWLGSSPDPLTSPGYPSHMGITAGKVEEARGVWAVLTLQAELSVRDGILMFLPGNGLDEPLRFSISSMKDSSDRPVTTASAGKTISLKLPRPVQQDTILYKISDHRLHWPALKPSSYIPFHHPVSVHAELSDTEIVLSTELQWTVPTPVLSKTFQVTVVQSRKKFPFRDKLHETLLSPGESLFKAEDVSWTNRSRLPDDEIFIPPRELKQLRRDWYDFLDSRFPAVNPEGTAIIHDINTGTVPARASLNPLKHQPVPFVTDPRQYDIEHLASDAEKIFIPLNPVIFSPNTYELELCSLLDRCTRASSNAVFVLGLNNISHAGIVNRIGKKYPVSAWIDVYWYLANNEAAAQTLDMIDIPILFGYGWLEHHKSVEHADWPFPAGAVESKFSPPLFMSRSSFSFETSGQKIPAERIISQRDTSYKVIELGDMTYLFSL